MQNIEFNLYIPLQNVQSIDEINDGVMLADLQSEGDFRIALEVVPSPKHVHSHVEVFAYDDSMGGDVIYQHRTAHNFPGNSAKEVFDVLWEEMIRFFDSGILEYPFNQGWQRFAEPEELEASLFHGTLVITDPVYIFRNAYSPEIRNWLYHRRSAGIHTPELHHFDAGSIGNSKSWTCNIYRNRPEELLGTFKASQGDVGIFLMEEIEAVNPHFSMWATAYPKSVTILPDFDGWAHVTHTKMPSGEIVASVLGGGSTCFHSIRT